MWLVDFFQWKPMLHITLPYFQSYQNTILLFKRYSFTSPYGLTHRRKSPHICGGYDIFFHSSWIRSRKIKENSWKEREKISLQFEPIFITVQCASQLQEFFKWKMMKKSSNWQRILRFSDHYCYSKLAMFGVKTLWKSCSFYLWFITPILEMLLKEIKKICCQFEWCNRDLILLKINPMRWWVKSELSHSQLS